MPEMSKWCEHISESGQRDGALCYHADDIFAQKVDPRVMFCPYCGASRPHINDQPNSHDIDMKPAPSPESKAREELKDLLTSYGVFDRNVYGLFDKIISWASLHFSKPAAEEPKEQDIVPVYNKMGEQIHSWCSVRSADALVAQDGNLIIGRLLDKSGDPIRVVMEPPR